MTLPFSGASEVSKDHVRVAAYGTVDELNSILGWVLTQISPSANVERLGRIQHDLFANWIGPCHSTTYRGPAAPRHSAAAGRADRRDGALG